MINLKYFETLDDTDNLSFVKNLPTLKILKLVDSDVVLNENDFVILN